MFFLWMVLMFYLTSDSSEKHIRFEKTFRHFCWNCILNVPRTFWGVFIENMFVFQFNMNFVAKFFEIWRNFSRKSSKMHFPCPEEHFDGNIVGFLKQIPPLGEKVSDLRRKSCRTVVIWALFVSRWPIGRIFLQKFLIFYIFSDVQVIFFCFFVESI